MKENKTYKVSIKLKPEGFCEFVYSDEHLAREQYLQYTSQGVINGVLIESIEFGPDAAKKTLELLK
ncbi:hypothetical protein UFOVP635_7 [uncultured Caudovirales phage]|uniref:Uncharacterized protein n=1 Tax=uncultured Caudovirales phage TaxID=2100421 RepID=A0A6J5N1Q7_9CAUD|nr:hypothetical protein UFOVP635_7 [uncultured Caudovirales phage]